MHFSPVFTATSDDVVHTASKRKLHDNLLLRSVVENHAGSGTELTPALAAGTSSCTVKTAMSHEVKKTLLSKKTWRTEFNSTLSVTFVLQ